MDAALIPVVETELPEGVGETWRETGRASSLSDVDFCLERLAEIQREELSDDALFDAKLAKLKAWHEAQQQKHARARAYFESQVRFYVETHPEEFRNGKKKSRALPSGTVGFRKAGGGLKVVDAAECVRDLKSWGLPELVRVKEEPNLPALKEHFKRYGVVPPGCELEPEREEVSIKINGGES